MESLIELVAASFARHGIECPAADSQLVWGRATSPVQAHVGVGALTCPAERSPAVAGGQSTTAFALAQTTRPAEPTALPEHNYRRSPQGDAVP